MKIFDCFLYNNENLILELRLNTLNKYIDKFVIIEAKYDHQGNKKKLNFKISNFKNFKKKIIYLVIKKFPKNLDNWGRENFHRDYILKGLTKANKEDYVLISDIDEIPNLSKLNNFKNFKYTVFEQKMFYYKLNLINASSPNWYGSRLCKVKHLKTPQWLRNQKIKKYSILKFYKIKWNIIKNGGWHFSFLMTPEEIKKKITSFAHVEYNQEYFKNIIKIKKAIKNKLDIFDRKISYRKIKINKSFPKYIFLNKNKFNKWIL